MSEVALILFTGDRVDWIDFTIKSCINFLEKCSIKTEIDIYLITWLGSVESKYDINIINYNKPTDLDILKFPKSNQQKTYNLESQKRIGFGHSILFGYVPDSINSNKKTFEKYKYIIKCRSDLVFETPKFNFNDNFLYTFECFWGGCRYIKNYSNDHFIFGKSEEVLKVISYNFEECILDKFWNPEGYMTYLFEKSEFDKIELTTDKYFLLSKDRESRKFIGYPMESINQNDILYLENMGIDTKKIKFTNKYDF
jgi:hypothetical protein